MSILLVNYLGEPYFDVLSYFDIARSIAEQNMSKKLFNPKTLTLPICRRARTEAYCLMTKPCTIQVKWEKCDVNTKNEIDLGTLTLYWDRPCDVLNTLPNNIEWLGDDGVEVFPVGTLINGVVTLDNGK